MNVTGIIAEYNPFHKGHLYHLRKSRKIGQADAVIVVMSGNFTQRGEPAIANKWNRAEMAIRNGADLVIELPFVYACNNAEFFAKGAVSILNSLGCVSSFSFGSETGDIEALTKVAMVLADEGDKFQTALKGFTKMGLSYPKARYEAIKSCYGFEYARHIKDSNNILAVEYLKQSILLKSEMKPIAVKRKGPGYYDEASVDNIASATAIRGGIQSSGLDLVKKYLPDQSFMVLARDINSRTVCLNDFFNILTYKILTSDLDSLSGILSAGEGLENKLKDAVVKSKTTADMVQFVKSKRYTETRINRLLVHALMNLNKEGFFNIVNENIFYARILGLSKRGGEILRRIKKQNCATIPVLSNINKELLPNDKVYKLLRYDILSSDLYNLVKYGQLYPFSDFVQKPYVEP